MIKIDKRSIPLLKIILNNSVECKTPDGTIMIARVSNIVEDWYLRNPHGGSYNSAKASVSRAITRLRRRDAVKAGYGYGHYVQTVSL